MQVSATNLDTLLQTSRFSPYVVDVWGSEQFNTSYHLHYDKRYEVPLAMSKSL
jgi:hypothetical protein